MSIIKSRCNHGQRFGGRLPYGSFNDSSSYRGAYDASTNGGAQYPDAGALWGDVNQLAQYDVLLLACGGNQSATNPAKTSPNPITDAAKANLVNYLAHGGRAFA